LNGKDDNDASTYENRKYEFLIDFHNKGGMLLISFKTVMAHATLSPTQNNVNSFLRS